MPKNYPMLIVLQSPDAMQASIKKWKELGALNVDEIIKNSPGPIDYHLRVSENDSHSGFG